MNMFYWTIKNYYQNLPSILRFFCRLAVYYVKRRNSFNKSLTFNVTEKFRKVVGGFLKFFTYSELVGWMRRGLRNGGWKKLTSIEKAYFRVAILYTKIWGKIVSSLVVDILLTIIEKLKTTPTIQILQVGEAKAEKMLSQSSEVFEWCPRFRVWLLDRTYRFWLGLTELSTRYVQPTLSP
jgi:hypothetical protein